jgi:hypothetical protein
MKNSKNKFLKIFLPILIFVLGFGGAAFGAVNIFNNINDKKGGYFDDDSAIIAKDDDALRLGSIKNTSGGYYKETTKKFSGIDKIATVDLPENASINIELKKNSGDFKVVLIDKNGTIYVVASTSVNATIALSLAAGKYDLKFVGRNANFSIKMEFIW